MSFQQENQTRIELNTLTLTEALERRFQNTEKSGDLDKSWFGKEKDDS